MTKIEKGRLRINFIANRRKNKEKTEETQNIWNI